MPSDAEYKRVKAIKNGRRTLTSPFSDMARWIDEKYGVEVLSVEYETVIPDNRPRLSVVLERTSDALKFRNGALGNFNRVDQKAIGEKFVSIASNNDDQIFDFTGLFVVFSSFESVARIEANERVPEKRLKKLKNQLKNENVWEVFRLFEGVTFFFFTDDQLCESESNEQRSNFRKLYYNLIKPFDEFGYLTLENISVSFDSKQNFDENYQSNWFYYTR